MSPSRALILERGLSALKYFIAFVLMIEGIATMVSPLTPMDGDLGFLYSSRAALVGFGLIFFASGFTLLYGKLKHSRKITGYGLLSIFICFLFATILQTTAMDGIDYDNGVAAVVVGALYLRWRFKTSYIDPNHFTDDAGHLHKHML